MIAVHVRADALPRDVKPKRRPRDVIAMLLQELIATLDPHRPSGNTIGEKPITAPECTRLLTRYPLLGAHFRSHAVEDSEGKPLQQWSARPPSIRLTMTLNPPKAALAVVDMQEDFCEPKGSLAIKGARELAPLINALLDLPLFEFRFATQDWHSGNHVSFASQHPHSVAMTSTHIISNPENKNETHTTTLWPDHCVQGSSGALIIPEIDRSRVMRVVQKGWDSRLESYSGFGPPFRIPAVSMTELDELLRAASVTHLFVVGVGFDGCVKHTALDAHGFGYRTFVIRDGVNAVARSEAIRDETLKCLDQAGVVVIDLGLSPHELPLDETRRKAIQDRLRALLTTAT